MVGIFGFIPDLKQRNLIDGKKIYLETHPNKALRGVVKEGKFKYYKELNGMYLIDGKVTLPNGKVTEGRLEYVPEMEDVVIMEGTVTYPYGDKDEGKYTYIPQLKEIQLVDGKYTQPSGEFEDGLWRYFDQLKGMYLEKGKRLLKDRTTEEGEFTCFPETTKDDTLLWKGRRMFPDGRVEDPTWDTAKNKICLPSFF